MISYWLTQFADANGFAEVVVFTDNAISSPVLIAVSLPAPPVCAVLPSVIAVEKGMRLQQTVMFKGCLVRGNATVTFMCEGCAAEELRLTVVCP